MAEIDGLDKLLRKFKKLSKLGKGVTLQRAAAAGGLVIANEAKRRAPVLTGNLRRSIHVGGESGAGEFGNLGLGPVSDTSGTVRIGTDVDYAAAVEFGTSNQSAQPYLRPAIDSQRDEAVAEVGAAFVKLVRAAAAD